MDEDGCAGILIVLVLVFVVFTIFAHFDEQVEQAPIDQSLLVDRVN